MRQAQAANRKLQRYTRGMGRWIWLAIVAAGFGSVRAAAGQSGEIIDPWKATAERASTASSPWSAEQPTSSSWVTTEIKSPWESPRAPPTARFEPVGDQHSAESVPRPAAAEESSIDAATTEQPKVTPARRSATRSWAQPMVEIVDPWAEPRPSWASSSQLVDPWAADE